MSVYIPKCIKRDCDLDDAGRFGSKDRLFGVVCLKRMTYFPKFPSPLTYKVDCRGKKMEEEKVFIELSENSNIVGDNDLSSKYYIFFLYAVTKR